MGRPHLGRLALACALINSPAVVSLSHRAGAGVRLAWSPEGRLVFEGSEKHVGGSGNSGPGGTFGAGASQQRELYPVTVGFNLHELNPADGAQVVFDKLHHTMRMDLGTGGAEGVRIAWGSFVDKITSTGWSELHLDTTEYVQVSNDVKMYAAGFLEGVLTSQRLAEYFVNVRQLLGHYNTTYKSLPFVRGVMNQELRYLRQRTNVVGHAIVDEPREPYWKHARYVLLQLWGICDGFNHAAHFLGVDVLDLEDLFLINSAGELPQLMQAFSPKALNMRQRSGAPAPAPSPGPSLPQQPGLAPAPGPAPALPSPAPAPALGSGPSPALVPGAAPGPSFLQRQLARTRTASSSSEDPLDDAHWESRMIEGGRCTAFVRLSEDFGDIYLGHTTWDDYSKMTRIFKYYNFILPGADTVATKIAFSAYPGTLTSTDDFYMTDSKLAIMETSLMVLDPSAWSRVWNFPDHPHIPGFAQVMITNRMARSASHWAWLMSKANAGTYTSQWMIVDYNKLEGRDTLMTRHPLPDNTFWVVEAVPGATESRDMTGHLMEHMYFPSFNRPLFGKIRDASGFTAAQRSHGDLYSWDRNPRAVLFRESARDVVSMFDMRLMMQRNRYPNSGVVPSSPGHDISARFDLLATGAVPNGGIDAKITNHCLVYNLEVQAISGPSHSTLPPFRWRGEDGRELWPGWPHKGLPDVWDFPFVQITPNGLSELEDHSYCGT